LLTAAQSDFEDGTTGGWVVNANCTLSNSTAQAHTGTHSLALTSVAAGDMAATTVPGLAGVPVVAGRTYSVNLWTRAATAARTSLAIIQWTDNTGAFMSQSVSVGVTNSTTAWTAVTETATAPPNAHNADAMLYVAGAGGVGEVHYVDTVLLGLSGVTPAWQDWRAGTTPYLTQTTVRDRTLRALASYVTNTNPDGTIRGS
jgi:endo-1,4-beta-xylanase